LTEAIIYEEEFEEISEDISRFLPMEINHYIEPICGSMETFINLNLKKQLPFPVLSDPDNSLISIYEYVKVMPEEFYQAMENSYRGRTKGALLALRKRYREIMNQGTMEEAAIYLQINVLNATRSKNLGIFGIFKDTTQGNKKREFPTETEIVEFSRMLQRTAIKRGSYRTVRRELSKNDFIFLNLRKHRSGFYSSDRKIEQTGQFKIFMDDLEMFQKKNIRTIIKFPAKYRLINNIGIHESANLNKIILEKSKSYEIWKNF
jgi:gluconate kinase